MNSGTRVYRRVQKKNNLSIDVLELLMDSVIIGPDYLMC